MKTVIATLSIVMLAAGASAPAAAQQPGSIDHLVLLCTSQSGDDVGFCQGYLYGVAATMELYGNSGLEGMCSDNYTPPMLRQIFLDWTTRNSEYGERAMLVGPFNAFKEQWPCGS